MFGLRQLAAVVTSAFSSSGFGVCLKVEGALGRASRCS